jgi:hypothetical protein
MGPLWAAEEKPIKVTITNGRQLWYVPVKKE